MRKFDLKMSKNKNVSIDLFFINTLCQHISLVYILYQYHNTVLRSLTNEIFSLNFIHLKKIVKEILYFSAYKPRMYLNSVFAELTSLSRRFREKCHQSMNLKLEIIDFTCLVI